MTYTKQTWVDGATNYPLSATRLNYIEQGIEDAHTLADTAIASLTTWAIANTLAVSINARTTNYTLVLQDSAKLVEMGSSSAITLTVPNNDTVAFPVGSQVTVVQTGTGQVTFTGAAGVTVNATPGLKLRTQWSSGSLLKRGTNTWVVFGDLVA